MTRNVVLRNATLDDLDGIYHLAKNRGVGVTSLPADINTLENKVKLSINSLNTEIKHPGNEYYLFVLEDLDAQKIVGTSAIDAAVGYNNIFYSYKVSTQTRYSHDLNIESSHDLLQLVTEQQGKSELCTLYLAHDYRRDNLGTLLSRARFLFIAEFPERFDANLFAELRGISDEEGNSLFYKEIAEKFLKIPFAKADELTVTTNKQFIADLMPSNPIYINMLTRQTRETIGKPHKSTRAAMKILEKEGFIFNNHVDIFDAGPTIESTVNKINSIKESMLLTISSIENSLEEPEWLISNNKINFRATVDNIKIKDITCIITKNTAKKLQLEKGDTIRVTPLHL